MLTTHRYEDLSKAADGPCAIGLVVGSVRLSRPPETADAAVVVGVEHLRFDVKEVGAMAMYTCKTLTWLHETTDYWLLTTGY